MTLVDTGEATATGGRLLRVADYLNDGDFCFTYGDGVSDVDITKLVDFHKSRGRLATVTAVTPPGRYGALERSGDAVTGFAEKPPGDGGAVNGGYFVLSPDVFGLISGDSCAWEGEPLTALAASGQLSAFEHHGFWQPMDTLRDKTHLEALWDRGEAPWKVWE